MTRISVGESWYVINAISVVLWALIWRLFA